MNGSEDKGCIHMIFYETLPIGNKKTLQLLGFVGEQTLDSDLIPVFNIDK